MGGWTDEVRGLDEELNVVYPDEPAVVLQDELRNSYSRETDT